MENSGSKPLLITIFTLPGSFFVSDKSEVTSVFWDFYNTVETQFNRKIAIMRNDNGREFQNHTLSNFCLQRHCPPKFLCLQHPTKWSSRAQKLSPFGSRSFSYVVYFPSLPIVGGSNDENEASGRVAKNEIREDPSENIRKFDLSLNLPIALRKGTKSYTKHSITNYVSYENLSLQFRAFAVSLYSTLIPNNINIALDCLEWKNAVMEEMRAFEKNKTWEICGLLKGHKTVGCKWVHSKIQGILNRDHMKAVNRILRYLKTTPESVVDRKSTSGYCTFVWDNLVTWRSEKQSVVARISAEAKVLSDLHRECVQWHWFINELGACFMRSQIPAMGHWAVLTDYRDSSVQL
ncbi:reverse transcriptase [Cucumis melo var. makuwa]|uniref:Reverse transcriptase n=1 Tax=Cucumis melo var. makuwa TaxID=1194695 RepID=A0A5D3E3B6_CUCMM|nr:reverse transcriptase [Cucumis melo var. makuwa]